MFYFCCSFSFRNGDVSNRYIELQELSEDGLIFSTNINTLKAKQMVIISYCYKIHVLT